MKYKKNTAYVIELNENEARAIYGCLAYAEQNLIKEDLGLLNDVQFDSIISLTREFRDLA